jgi:hypothetical protein
VHHGGAEQDEENGQNERGQESCIEIAEHRLPVHPSAPRAGQRPQGTPDRDIDRGRHPTHHRGEQVAIGTGRDWWQDREFSDGHLSDRQPRGDDGSDHQQGHHDLHQSLK